MFLNYSRPSFEPSSTQIIMFTCLLMCVVRSWKFPLYKSIYYTLFLHYPISPSPAYNFVDAHSHSLMRVRSPNFVASLFMLLTMFLLYIWIV